MEDCPIHRPGIIAPQRRPSQGGMSEDDDNRRRPTSRPVGSVAGPVQPVARPRRQRAHPDRPVPPVLVRLRVAQEWAADQPRLLHPARGRLPAWSPRPDRPAIVAQRGGATARSGVCRLPADARPRADADRVGHRTRVRSRMDLDPHGRSQRRHRACRAARDGRRSPASDRPRARLRVWHDRVVLGRGRFVLAFRPHRGHLLHAPRDQSVPTGRANGIDRAPLRGRRPFPPAVDRGGAVLRRVCRRPSDSRGDRRSDGVRIPDAPCVRTPGTPAQRPGGCSPSGCRWRSGWPSR